MLCMGAILNTCHRQGRPNIWVQKDENRQQAVFGSSNLSMLKHGRDGLFVADATNGLGQHG